MFTVTPHRSKEVPTVTSLAERRSTATRPSSLGVRLERNRISSPLPGVYNAQEARTGHEDMMWVEGCVLGASCNRECVLECEEKKGSQSIEMVIGPQLMYVW